MGAAPHLLSTMDYTCRERQGEAIYRFKGLPSRRRGTACCPSDFFRRNVVLSFQEDAIGIRLRDVIGVDNIMWGSDYPHSESTSPQSRKILSEILAGVPDDEQAKPAPDHDPGIAVGNTARVYNFDVARLTILRDDIIPSCAASRRDRRLAAGRRHRRLHCRSWCGKGRNGRSFGPTALALLHSLR